MVQMHDEHEEVDHMHNIRHHHHINERGEEVIGDEVELEEMEEVIDETGQRMFLRADGNIMVSKNTTCPLQAILLLKMELPLFCTSPYY